MRRARGRYVIVVGEGEDCEVWGVFENLTLAERLCDEYNEQAQRPYEANVVEVWSARLLQQQVIEEREVESP